MSYQNQPLDHQEGSIDSLISTVPNALDATRPEVIEAGLYYLPYSTGFEIECDQAPNFNVKDFKNIPNIMDVNTGCTEQRFRIPNGIIGLQCLYDISIQLKLNSLLNSGSGIHYHIDCTDIFDNITNEDIEDYKPIILERLDKWDYKGSFNSRNMSRGRCWVRVHDKYKTLEIRIGEMTFDYDLLFKRIIDANDIVRNFKEYMRKRIIIRDNTVDLLYEEEDFRTILKNRTKKI